MKKRIFCVLLAACLAVGMLAGCAGGGHGSGTQGGSQVIDEDLQELIKNIPGEIPDLSGYTITLMTSPNFDSVESYTDILPIYKQIEALTGVTLVWEEVAKDTYDTILSTRLLSEKDTPDIFWSGAFVTSNKINGYAKERIVYDITQAYDVCPNIKEYMDNMPSYVKAFSAADGAIYTIPTSRYASSEDYFSHRQAEETFGYRGDIAEELGFTEEPETIQDWYELLTAVKKNYPDMIPYNCNSPFSWGIDDLAFGAAYGIQSNVTVFNKLIWGENREIEYQAVGDEMLAYVTEMNKWYKEGLIQFSAGGNNRESLPLSGKVFSGTFGVTGLNKKIAALREIDEDAYFLAAPYPSCDGFETAFMGRRMWESAWFVADKGDEQSRAALQFIDFAYFSEYGRYSQWFGPMGTDTWYFDENGELVVNEDHIIAKLTGEYNVKDDGGDMWYGGPTANFNLETETDQLKEIVQKYYEETVDPELLELQQDHIDATKKNYEHYIEPFEEPVMSEEDTYRVNLLLSDINTCARETIAGMIAGTVDISSWDAYVNKMYDQLNLQEVLDIYSKYLKN